jgi:hypothetical protein
MGVVVKSKTGRGTKSLVKHVNFQSNIHTEKSVFIFVSGAPLDRP